MQIMIKNEQQGGQEQNVIMKHTGKIEMEQAVESPLRPAPRAVQPRY